MSRRARPPKVGIKWEAREDEEGRRYAILRWTENGRRRNHPLGYVSPEEAEAARRVREAELLLGISQPASSTTVRVDDVLAAYLREVQHRPVSDTYSAGELLRCTRLGDHLGRLAAEELTPDTLSRYLGDRRREASRFGDPPRRSSLQMEIETLRRALRHAVEARLIRGPIVSPPRGRLADDGRPARRLTEAEVAKLVAAGHREDDAAAVYDQLMELQHLGFREAARRLGVPWGTAHRWIRGFPPARAAGLGWLVQVLAWSGRRPIAVLGLHVEDLARLAPEVARKDQLVYWRVDKGGVSRGWGPVTEPARSALVARAAEVGSGPLWPALHASKDVWRVLGRVALAAGVEEVQPYDLRRHAVTAIMRGVGNQPRVAMRYTGHTQVQTLLRYLYDEVDAAESLAAGIGWTKPELVVAKTGEGS